MRIVFILLFPLLVYSQTNFVSTSSYESNFQLVQSEIASIYNPKTTNFTGNKYFYKLPKDAILVLFDTDEPITVKTNYNLLDQSFDILSDDNDKTLKLLPNKIQKVSFDDRVLYLKMESSTNQFMKIMIFHY